MQPSIVDADVVVVGAGPGGSAAAAHLAAAGRDVVLVEKDAFPRDKVCGDGLTPRVVRELEDLGLHDEAKGTPDGWMRHRGLRIHGGHTVMELPWPELEDWPGHSLTATRTIFDERIARHAVDRGAQLWEQTSVTGPRWSNGEGSRVSGVHYKDADGNVGEVRAPIVLACDGASSRFAIATGMRRQEDRPFAVAVRTYYESPRADDDHISSFLDLEEGDDLLPGYGWVFPLDDGTLNVGLGLLDSSSHFGKVNYRDLMLRWARGMEDAWGTSVANQRGKIRSGPLPMGFNRNPLHRNGVLLIGDAGGFINPFNGEGISYAMEAGQLAAQIADRALEVKRTDLLDTYDRELRHRWGGYYRLGKVFTDVMGNPTVMRICTEYGMPHRPLMNFVLKTMAHLTDHKPKDVHDVVINTLQRLTPAAH